MATTTPPTPAADLIAAGASPFEASPLARCTTAADNFLRHTWDRAPHLAADPLGRDFADLLSLDDVDELLTARGLRFPHLRVVRDGQPVPRADYTTTRSVGRHRFDDAIEPGRVIEAFRQGATIVFQALHTHWSPLGRFCAALAAELGHPAQANAYLSPRQARGLAVHYDTHDVFALQLHGTKDWEVFPAAFESPLGSQHWSDVRVPDDPEIPEPDGPPLVASTLGPGQSLYVPRGFVHRAHTTADVSLHLTIGVRNRTWHDAVRALAARTADDPRFRATLPTPTATTGEDDLRRFRTLVRDWLDLQPLDDLVDADHGRQLVESAGYYRGILRDVVAPLDDGTRLSPRHPDGAVTLEDDGDDVVIVTPDRRLRIPGRARPAIEHLLDRRGVELGNLADLLDEAGRIVLARRLVAEGILAPSALLDDPTDSVRSSVQNR